MTSNKDTIILDPYNIEFTKIKDSSLFREAAIRFEKLGYYTVAPKGTSAYIEYWKEEKQRCKTGFTTSNGDFISGYFYFYLNYCPITLDKYNSKTQRTERTLGFPRVYDYDWYYYNAVEEAERRGKHLVVIKKRGAGYSFKGGSMLARNFYMFPGSNSYAIAEEAEFLTKDGLLTKAWDFMDFIDQHTAFAKKRQKISRVMHRRASYELAKDGVKIEKGYKSDIIGVTLKNDAQKARGKRGKLILWEEAGKFKGLKTAWQVARPSVEGSDGVAHGLMIAYGTGGTNDAEYESLRDLFYEPDAYNVLPIVNVWDDGASKPCSFFVPQYYNMGDRFMDEHGNSKVKEAIKFELAARDLIIKTATDKNAVDRYVAEKPFTPQEATLQISSNIFPKAELSKQLSFIRTNKKVQEQKQVGKLVTSSDGALEWKQSKEANDLTKYRIEKGTDPTGAIVIWEHPIDDPPYGLYIAGCLTPGEKVVTSEGLKNVEEVTLEDKLVSKDGNIVPINTLLRYDKVDEPIYKVHMNNVSRPTTYTQEHPLYLSETADGEYDFIRMRDVKEGMWTKYPNYYRKEKETDLTIWDKYKQPHTPIIDNPLEKEDFWWFIGHWLGDGFNYNQGRNYTIYNSFGNSEIEYVDKYKDIVISIFGRKPCHKLQNGSNTHKFESKQLYLFLEDNFGKYAHGKFISDWVKYIPYKYKLQLILGYLDSDGTVYTDKTTTRATFKSINRTLLNDVQDILFSLGIISSFNSGGKPGFYNINGKQGKTKESYALRLNQTELKRLADKFRDTHNSRKLRTAKQIDNKKKSKKSQTCFITKDNRYIHLKIKSIEADTYTGVVYNFDCVTHTFLCQYCTGHNCDPYDHDKSGTNSLGSTFIYKRFQGFESYYDVIVAEYTGRPDTADDYYENVRKLLLYYNAKLLYENERKGIFPYFTHKHCDYLLVDQPDIINDIVQQSKVQRKKGIHMVTAIKDWAEGRLRDWLIEDRGEGKLNLHTILSEPLLEELINYNDTGNFDRVIAMMMVMIYKEELHNIKVKEKTEVSKKVRFMATPIFAQDFK